MPITTTRLAVASTLKSARVDYTHFFSLHTNVQTSLQEWVTRVTERSFGSGNDEWWFTWRGGWQDRRHLLHACPHFETVMWSWCGAWALWSMASASARAGHIDRAVHECRNAAAMMRFARVAPLAQWRMRADSFWRLPMECYELTCSYMEWMCRMEAWRLQNPQLQEDSRVVVYESFYTQMHHYLRGWGATPPAWFQARYAVVRAQAWWWRAMRWSDRRRYDAAHECMLQARRALSSHPDRRRVTAFSGEVDQYIEAFEAYRIDEGSVEQVGSVSTAREAVEEMREQARRWYFAQFNAGSVVESKSTMCKLYTHDPRWADVEWTWPTPGWDLCAPQVRRTLEWWERSVDI